MAGGATFVEAGRDDVARAQDGLAHRVPEPLGVLARIAYDYGWSWRPGGHELFAAVDARRWRRCQHNPVRLLQEAPWEALERAAADDELLERAHALAGELEADRERPAAAWAGASPERPVAYFCAEYGIHASLPIYSGGLGALAGDLVKEASDRAAPLVAVGLMYRQGYFRQRIDRHGWQQEYWVDTDPERVPAALVTDAGGEPLTVSVPLREEVLVAQVWRVDVGRVPLFLLDSNRPENGRTARWTTSQLYVGDPGVRLNQYALLGVGGMRALRALGIGPAVVHLNEGHAALGALGDGDGTLDELVEQARARTVFTTHTPVPAGNDAYPGAEVAELVRPLAAERGVDLDALLRLGRTHPDDEHEPFGITQLALRTARRTTGVSRRHGEVARAMWQDMWPGRDLGDVPIGHVTNGVHVPTWVGGPVRALLDRHLGPDWLERVADPELWAAADGLPGDELWAARRAQRAALVDYVRLRAASDRLWRSEDRPYVESGAHAFDPDVLTIGFARRVATYKRLRLMVHDAPRALALLAGDRPLQLVIAGKAHPRDDEAKQLIHDLLHYRGAPEVDNRVVFLHDYDLAMAAKLVQGCDVWLNLPRAPLEASGTSGMKAAVNGALQLSVLDGWWAEACDGLNGWGIPGEVDADQQAQDARDAGELYRLLEEEVVPTFYERDPAGLPQAWLHRVRHSLRTVVPRFSAARMLAEYESELYRP